LNASNITTGILGSSQLSGNYLGSVSFSSASNSFTGSGAGLTSLNAGALLSGVVPSDRIQGTYGQAVQFSNGTFTGTHSGNGAGLTNLNLSGPYSNAVNFSNAGNAFTGNGAGLTALNATNITSGNLASARMPTGGSWTLSSFYGITGPPGTVTAVAVTSPSYNGVMGSTGGNVGVGVYGVNTAGGRGVVGRAFGSPLRSERNAKGQRPPSGAHH
jgi:hypothetical protein